MKIDHFRQFSFNIYIFFPSSIDNNCSVVRSSKCLFGHLAVEKKKFLKTSHICLTEITRKVITNRNLFIFCFHFFFPFFKFRIEEAKRAMKRTSSDRYDDIDRSKRRNVETNERRFEPPPPPRFDATIRSSNYDRAPEKKRIDDYPNR